MTDRTDNVLDCRTNEKIQSFLKGSLILTVFFTLLQLPWTQQFSDLPSLLCCRYIDTPDCGKTIVFLSLLYGSNIEPLIRGNYILQILEVGRIDFSDKFFQIF